MAAVSPTQTRVAALDKSRELAARPTVQVCLAAATLAAIYGVGLVVPMPLWAGTPVGPGAAVAQEGIGWPGLLVPIGLVLILCGPYRPYVLAVRAAASGGLSVRLVVALTVLLATVGLLIYPRFGSDLFDYVAYERLWVVYGANPLVVAANSHPADWSYPFVWFVDRPPAYGPLWVLLTGPLVWLAGDSPAGAVLAYKLLALVSYVTCCGLIWLSVEPARRLRSMMLFAWSPLVLFEVLGKVHNDGLTAALVLAAVLLAARLGPTSALLGGVAAALVKASVGVIAPVLVLRQVRARRWRELAASLALATALAALLYAPFWSGPDTLRGLLQQTGRVVWSPGALLIAVTSSVPGGPYDVADRGGLALVWAAACLLALWRARTDTLADFALTSATLLLLTLLLLTTAFYAHYLVPAIALAAVSGDRRLERVVLALSIGGLAAYSTELVGLAVGSGWIGSRAYQVLGSLLILAPLAPALFRPRAAHSS